MRLRPPRHQRRIKPESQLRAGDHHVALVELDAGECAEVAAQDDGQHAKQRDRDAGELGQGQPDPEQHQRPHRHEQRSRGLDQQRIQRLGVLQPPIGQRVVDGKSGRRQQHHQWKPCPQRRPVLLQMRPGKRQQHQEGADPADAGQRHRRHMAGDIAREHDIAGPEQRGQAQEQIGLVTEPSDRVGGRRCGRGNCHLLQSRVVPEFRRATSPASAMLQCRNQSGRGAGDGRGSVEYRWAEGAGAPGAGRDGEPDAVSCPLARRRRLGLGRLFALQRPDGADDQGARRHPAVDRRRQGGRARASRTAINGTIWRWCIIPRSPPSST